jgi:hypothetical protein
VLENVLKAIFGVGKSVICKFKCYTITHIFCNYKSKSGPASVQMRRYSSAGKCIEGHLRSGHIGDMQVEVLYYHP